MQLCKYTSMKVCRYATMQLCKCESTLIWKDLSINDLMYVNFQAYNYATMWACHHTGMQLWEYGRIKVHICMYKGIPVCNYARTQVFMYKSITAL